MRRISHATAEDLARDLEEALDVSAIASVLERLDQAVVPQAPTAPETLLARVRPHLPATAPRRFREEGLSASPQVGALRYVLAQVWLFRPGWWLWTLAGTVLGLVLTHSLGLAFGLVAPPLVAIGVAYSLRAVGTPAWEMEQSSPVQPVQLILARVAVVLGWVTALGALSTAVVGLSGFGDWFAGMLLFTGVTLLSVILTDPRLGAALGLIGWLLLTLLHMVSPAIRPLWGVSNLTAVAVGAACSAAALLVLISPLRTGRREG